MNDNSNNTPLSRKERDKIRNKEAIMDAAVHLFAQNGFNETKLDEVAALAEFGKGTIYNYFESKNDLLLSTFDYALGKVTSFLNEQLTTVSDPIDRLRLIVNSQFKYYSGHEDFLRVVMTNQQIIQQAMCDKPNKDLHQRFMYLRKMMLKEIQAAIDAGSFRAGNTERYASYLSGMIHGQVRSLNQREITIEDVDPDEIVDIFLRGVTHV